MKTISTRIFFSILAIVLINNSSFSQNLAYLKPVTVSAIESSGFSGNMAVDGFGGSGQANTSTGYCNTGNCTRWSSGFSDPQWITVDLQAIYNLTQVRIYWEVASGRNFQIQVSNDGSTWTTVKTISNNTSFYNAITLTNATGRYLRMYGTARNTGYGFSIYEFEAYGSLSSAGSTLPVHLENFSAARNGSDVNINWTASIDNKSSFTIERSADGQNFSAIGTVNDNNAPANSRSYRFNDANPLNQKAYYRLKYVELGSDAKYSSIVVVNYASAQNTTISVYPNPAYGSTITVSLPKPASGMIETSLLNASGNTVFVSRTQASNAAQVQVQKNSSLPSGTYVVQVKTSEYQKSTKVFIP